MGVNSRPTVPEAVNIGCYWGRSRPKRRTEAYQGRPEASGNDEFLMSNDERMTKSQIRKGAKRVLSGDFWAEDACFQP